MHFALEQLKAKRRAFVAAGVGVLVLAFLATSPRLLGPEVRRALAGLGAADRKLLWLAGVCFVGSIVGAAGSWRAAIGLCGGQMTLGDACARFGAGCLVNTFAPARLGDAIRIALFSRALPHRDRLWSTGGAFAAIGAGRAFVLCVLVVFGAAVGALPLWPVLVLGTMVAAAGLAAWRAQRRRAHGHLSHLLDAFRALGRDPLAGLPVVGWIAFATVARVGAAATVAAALGVRAPLAAALIVVPTLDIAGLVPLTPGNFGVAAGAVAMALHEHGVGVTRALTAGIAFHAVETAAGILFGAGGALALAQRNPEGERRWAVAAVGAFGCVMVAFAFSATVLVDWV
jgi:uncharacterized membrane protein YbhN (UPF0104 family)